MVVRRALTCKNTLKGLYAREGESWIAYKKKKIKGTKLSSGDSDQKTKKLLKVRQMGVLSARRTMCSQSP